MLYFLVQPKEGQQFKNKNQPHLPENRTLWKSDNQGVKEETFMQTGMRGRDRQLGGTHGHMARWQTRQARLWLADQQSHKHVQISLEE